MASISELIKKRKLLKSSLTRFTTFVNAFDSQSGLVELEFRLERADRLLREFEEIQIEIELLNDNEGSEDESSEKEEFENRFFAVMAKAKQLLKVDSNCAIMRPFSSVSDTLVNVKLPTIKLPEFTGAYDEWLQFAETFNALVDQNSTLPIIQKFYYLKGCLKGEASKIIHAVEVCEANYTVAWDLLRGRYENTRLISHNHVRALFEMQSMHRESQSALRQILDEFQKHVRSLKALEEPVEHWDTLLIYLLTSKLDTTTNKEWEASLANQKTITIGDLTKFITNRCVLLETIEGKQTDKNIKRHGSASHIATNKFSCAFCAGKHFIYNCENFLKLDAHERANEAKKKHLCINCLRKGHYAKQCTSKYKCRVCREWHHTLLHAKANRRTEVATEKSEIADVSADVALINQIAMPCIQKTQVLLSTAMVQVLDVNKNPKRCRVLLDSGSQINFVTRSFLKRLNLPTLPTDWPISGIGASCSKITERAEVSIKSLYCNYAFKVQVLVLERITDDMPAFKIDRNFLNIPTNLTLADPHFHETGAIDMLIGAALFFDLLCVGQIRLGKNLPIAQKTKLGWILAGPVLSIPRNYGACNLAITNNELQNSVERFWKIEELNATARDTKEEILCEQHFIEHTKRNEDGRFEVSLPFKVEPEMLGDSKATAIKRLYALERKLAKNPQLRDQYCKFMTEYETLGHMSKVSVESDSVKYYIPHHCVIREDSLTTKLRVVFDASCKTSTNLSLNDILMVGPTVQQDLFSLLIRFRGHAIVVTADAEKMYRQVNVNSSQRDLQRIVWRSTPEQEIVHYQLNTVTYGTAPAAFLATRALVQLAKENDAKYPNASKIIKRDFYMDDLITGFDSIEDAIKNIREVDEILRSAGFILRKWASNSSELLMSLRSQDSNATEYYITDGSTKILGLRWEALTDKLSFKVNSDINIGRVTKRTILAAVAQIFDPLGVISPVTTLGKIMLQELWKLELDWDSSVPIEIHTIWSRYAEQLKVLNYIQIIRSAVILNSKSIQLHGFCDASERAYGACIYICSGDDEGLYQTHILCAKSRVAPLKCLSLPRLELSGALLLAKLLKRVKIALDVKIDSVHLWCDSTITLSWIRADPGKWKTFVSNRVAEVQELTDIENWSHVPTADNPADLISRGATPEVLKNSNLWWYGPEWISNRECWPPPFEMKPVELPEMRHPKPICLTASFNEGLISQFSSLNKLKRVTAYIFRFYHNCKDRTSRSKQGLKVVELQQAFLTLLRLTQQSEFAFELKALKNSKPLPSNSKLLCLDPFLSEDNLIRVGGRLTHSNLTFDQKHQIVLPEKHHLTCLVFENEHKILGHAGPQHLLYSLRNKFWPLSGRKLARQIVHKCIKCFRVKPIAASTKVGDLPKERVVPSLPFLITGVDYAGPFTVRDRKGRGAKLHKCYISLFVCFSTKAIHLELVSDLTTECFIAALRRFIARRGMPQELRSDNGSNFVGCKNELAELSKFIRDNETSLTETLQNEGIKWRFIPPNSPHFGGIWEAGVKRVKYHLKRVLGDVCLSFEGFNTVIVQIEAILNSRPLSPMSSSPNDLQALTPSHFLIGRVPTSIPDPEVMHIPENRLSFYQLIQRLKQHFWARWSKEFLSDLQMRHKRRESLQQIEIGTLALIKEDNLPPASWRLGRVIELHPGVDKKVRVVTLRTVKGFVRRAVVKLCPLPTTNNVK